MTDINLDKIKQLDAKYRENISEIEKSYRCQWDDNVHASYGKYVMEIKKLSDDLKSIKCDMEILEQEIKNLNLQELKNQADSHCREAETV